MAEKGRRRIDRVAAPDFLDGVESRTPQEIRSMRDECREEEIRLSYGRRLLQGRIDIVRAEQARRRGETTGGLISALPSILADANSMRRSQPQARPSPVYSPGPDHDRRVEDDPGLALGQLPELDDDALGALEQRLTQDERALSELRQRVLAHLDRLEVELVAHLRRGALNVDELIPPGLGGETDTPRPG